ncbi:MAG: hydrogenase 4 subunit B [Rhodospirillaceae bacterium]|jgi:formate hydrogenlyase subunit 3/multisubunit Na+/H+ antiporter MnhD subunit|nr:hydrogenase 4 subunit B [Rhodospirillaceae bacterium]
MIIGIAFIGFLILSLCAVLFRNLIFVHEFIYAGCMFVTLILVIDGICHIGIKDISTIVLPFGLPWLNAHFCLDSISIFFLIALNIPMALASLFGIGYGGHVPYSSRVTPLFPLFLFGMNCVLVADDVFVFLVSWEFMSLTSWLLILSNHTNLETRKAALIYIVMATFGTFCLLSAFGLMMTADNGDYSFFTMKTIHLSSITGVLVVLLTLLGTGSKAGLIPLHAWLPLAHPAVPSHISALMSGVMTNVAIYGVIRILYDLHGNVDWQCGFIIMALGAITAALGIFYAIMQRDLKTILAYSTIENVGIIFIAIGLTLAFRDYGKDSLSTLSLVAALYHVINHALCKSLLFFGSGAVLYATGERDLDKLGGLLKRMPITGLTFLIGSCAISTLPPLNCFVSEWLIFQSLFNAPTVDHWAMRFGVPVIIIAMALASALTAVCFVRAFGIVFLGRPRSHEARHAIEVPISMRIAMIILTFLCLCLGLIPLTMTREIASIIEPMVHFKLFISGLGWPWLSLINITSGSYSATIILMIELILIGITIFIIRYFGIGKIRRAPAWDCGHNEDICNSQYSSDSFSQPLRRIFGSIIFRAREEIEMPQPGELISSKFSVSMIDPIWKYLYLNIMKTIDAIADRVNIIQFMTVRNYLLLMFITLVLLLLVVALRQ